MNQNNISTIDNMLRNGEGTSDDQGHGGPDYIPTTAQEQLLLDALQGFISSHTVGTNLETERKPFSPQAKKLIMALKDFISNMIGCSAETGNDAVIEAVLDDSALQETEDITDACPADPSQADSLNFSAETKQHIPSAPIRTTFHDKVLQELRNQVFNKMPIRLLKFVPKGPLLDICLIERGAVYNQFALQLQAKINDAEYRPIVRKFYLWAPPRLETEEEAIHRITEEYASYAILSHTWLQQSPELIYGNWKAGILDAQGPGYHKLVNFCKVAYQLHGLTLGWMDTICINKDSSSELDESIRSMYNWYERSKVCIVYLAETERLTEMHCDPWFTRGWTLQELLASQVLKFYNQRWQRLADSENDKNDDSTTAQIKKATTISTRELSNIRVCSSLSRRMQLAAPRKVTREEDTAYSLMGLFDVSISTAYGEGAECAFYRLLQEILNSKSRGVLDLFNWAGQKCSSNSKILPVSPEQYLVRSSSIDLNYLSPIEPFISTHMGLRIPVLLMPGISIQNGKNRVKPCGAYSATVAIAPLQIYRNIPTSFRLLDSNVSGHDGKVYSDNYRSTDGWQFTFAVFNITQNGPYIVIQPRCIAVPLECHEDVGNVTSTGKFDRGEMKEPVVFDMLMRNPRQNDESATDYLVLVDKEIKLSPEDLAKNGMQLVFKYL